METINFNFARLKDFNDVINYYKKQLELIKKMKPMKRFTFSDGFKDLTFGYDRVLLNNLGISIAQNFDYIERNHPQNIDELILKELRFNDEQCETEEMKNAINNFEFAFKRIMQDNNLTALETLKQIRNAFLHGNYQITFKSSPDKDKIVIKNYGKNDDDDSQILIYGDKEIKLHSTKMDGILPYPETISLIDYIFYNIRSRCTTGNREFTISDKRYISCKNEHFLREYLNSLQSFYIIPKERREKGNIEQILSRFPTLKVALESMQRIDGTNFFDIQKIPESEMEQRKKDIENFIRYVGKNNWKYFYLEGMNIDLFDNIFQSRFNDTITTISLSNSFCGLINQMCNANRDGTEMPESAYKEMTKLSFEVPFIYADMLLGLLNYGCGYLKANSADNNSLFEYHNLEGFDGVNPLIDNDRTKSIQYGVSGQEKQRKIDLAIETYQVQLKKVNRDINKANRQISNLNENNPNREKMEIELRKSIEEKTSKKEEIMNQIFKLSIRKEEYNQDYTDYSELFRHLRNSIAHGRYEVEYDKALKSDKLDKIKFTFFDYNEDNLERKEPDFKLELTASKVIKIINGIQNRVNNQLSRENQMEKIIKTKLEDIVMPDIEVDDDENEIEEL